MNDAQKNSVTQLREAGYSYVKIGEMLGLSENTVKSYCQRNKIGGRKEQEPDVIAKLNDCCEQCGEPFVNFGKNAKRFCSPKCRSDWWNAHPEKRSGRGLQKRICKHCGKEFNHYGDRVYCGHSCYITARFTNDTRAICT